MSDSEELARLADLHQRGALSDEEFARAKSRLLNGEATARSSAAANPALNVTTACAAAARIVGWAVSAAVSRNSAASPPGSCDWCSHCCCCAAAPAC